MVAAVALLPSWGADRPLSVEQAAADATSPATSPVVDDGGFEALSVRLRVDDGMAAATAPDDAAGAAGEGAPVGPVPTVAAGDLAIAPPPDGFDGVATTAAPTPPLELPPSRYDAATATGGTWALIIGINDYPGVRYDLRSAVNDADDVDQALARLGVTADRRMVLRDGQAGASTIRAALDWLTAHAGPDATIVLFYAGHVRKAERGREVLVGSDGGIVPDTEVAAMLDRSPAQRAWIAIAGCYAGGFDEVVRPGRILTAAAPSDRVAYENEGFGRSYLVEYMVRRGILGRGLSTVEGAFAWASAELQRDFPERVPVQLDAVAGELDLRVGPPPPPPPPPSSSSSPGSGAAPPPGSSPPPSEPTPPPDSCSTLTVGVVRCS